MCCEGLLPAPGADRGVSVITLVKRYTQSHKKKKKRKGKKGQQRVFNISMWTEEQDRRGRVRGQHRARGKKRRDLLLETKPVKLAGSATRASRVGKKFKTQP